MRISKKAVWIALSSYEERSILKAAGWWWHPGPGRCDRPRCRACEAGVGAQWWTPDLVAASRLLQYADGDIRAELEEVKAAQEASKAADASIEIPAPTGIEYLPFQRAGIAYAMSRPGVLFADEMGLGKTIQALGVINADPTVKKVLAVVPATLRLNWEREARKWLVRPMKVRVLEGRDLPEDTDEFVIVNYEKFVGEKGKPLHDWCMGREWDLLIADEAHYLKTPSAQRTKLVLGKRGRKGEEDVPGLASRARRKIFMTGTPILNKPVEAFGLLHTLAPDTFPEFFPFAKRYCAAYQGRWGWDFSGASNLDELQAKMRATCMVRRLKKDVLRELPPKRRQIVVLPANGAAKAIAEESRVWASHEEALAEAQAAADLAHAAGDEDAYKAAVEQLRKAWSVAFSEISRVRHETAVAKIPSVIEHVDGILEDGVEKVVVWAHHHDVIRALSDHYGDSCVVITGETPQENRMGLVDRFQTDPDVKIFLGSITAAGVGITLTAASMVVFAELDWVPANVTQAEDRCHRIGQSESVLVQHLVLDGSLDARMAELLVQKQEIADRALDLPFERSLPVLPVGGVGPRPAKYPLATDEQKATALEGLRILAGMCDGAYSRDDMGFNKGDSKIGKALARLDRLTDGQFWLARRILPKYHRQIGEELLAKMGYTMEVKHG